MSLSDLLRQQAQALRKALIASQTWLYGHDNAEGQAERRRLNAEILAQGGPTYSNAHNGQAGDPAGSVQAAFAPAWPNPPKDTTL